MSGYHDPVNKLQNGRFGASLSIKDGQTKVLGYKYIKEIVLFLLQFLLF